MTKETTLTIPAIHCESCVRTVERTLKGLAGVQVAGVDVATKRVRVQFEGPSVSLEQIREALDEVGFSAED